jgi:predicted AAA+ superfamily ATPase
MGPRRVGKTFLLHHAIARLIDDGVPPKNVCYVSVDNPIYVHLSLDQILSLYSEAAETNATANLTYIIFDEVQYLRDWEVHLKSIVDTWPNIKCVASGSAAAALRLKSDESGAGRFTDFLLPPVTFFEYLVLKGDEALIKIEAATEGRPEVKSFTAVNVIALNEKFVHYLNFGGYPEVIFSSAIQEDPGRFIKNDIIDKVLLRDLPSLYGIQDIQELNALFTSLAYNTAQELSLEDLSTKSGVAKQTIKRYIEYLEAAFLIRTVRRVDQNSRHFKRARTFKVYLTNSSMRTALFSPLDSEDARMGALVETGIFSQWFHSDRYARLHYARWKSGEVDIVSLDGNQEPQFAIEVKWSDRYCTRLSELQEPLLFCQKNALPSLTVTTKTKTETAQQMGIKIRFWPAALYAFILGYNIISAKQRARIADH